jgi:hypothetical protein
MLTQRFDEAFRYAHQLHRSQKRAASKRASVACRAISLSGTFTGLSAIQSLGPVRLRPFRPGENLGADLADQAKKRGFGHVPL